MTGCQTDGKDSTDDRVHYLQTVTLSVREREVKEREREKKVKEGEQVMEM